MLHHYFEVIKCYLGLSTREGFLHQALNLRVFNGKPILSSALENLLKFFNSEKAFSFGIEELEGVHEIVIVEGDGLTDGSSQEFIPVDLLVLVCVDRGENLGNYLFVEVGPQEILQLI